MPGPSATTPPLTAEDAARELTRLAGAFADAFARLSAAAAVADRPAARLALDTAARVLGRHAHALAELVPESVLLAPARAAGEADPLALGDDPAGIVAALAAALAAVVARATPVADGALLRTAAAVAADLDALAPRLVPAG